MRNAQQFLSATRDGEETQRARQSHTHSRGRGKKKEVVVSQFPRQQTILHNCLRWLAGSAVRVNDQTALDCIASGIAMPINGCGRVMPTSELLLVST